MPDKKDTLIIRVNVEVTAATLQAIVANAKQIAGPDERGSYQIDTADKAGEMISCFLLENDFESFVRNIENYRR
jgi:hypothetical protein